MLQLCILKQQWGIFHLVWHYYPSLRSFFSTSPPIHLQPAVSFSWNHGHYYSPNSQVPLLCLCMHVHVGVWWCKWYLTHIWMWRPEDGLNLSVQVLSMFFVVVVIVVVFRFTKESSKFPVISRDPSISTSQSWHCKYAPRCLSFTLILEVELRSLWLQSKHLPTV